MEGKPLVIADAPPERPLPDQWLGLRLDAAEELDHALHLLSRVELLGLYLHGAQGLPLWDTFRAAFRDVQAAGGVVIDEGGRLLAIRRLGRWDLPKGKVDPGEGIQEAALREVREECGLSSLEVLRPAGVTWHTYTHNEGAMLKRTDWFLMRGTSAEPLRPQQEEDIHEVRWLDAEGVMAMRADTYASLLPLIDLWERLPERG